MCVSITVNVINGQEFGMRLSAALANRTAVSVKSREFQTEVSRGTSAKVKKAMLFAIMLTAIAAQLNAFNTAAFSSGLLGAFSHRGFTHCVMTGTKFAAIWSLSVATFHLTKPEFSALRPNLFLPFCGLWHIYSPTVTIALSTVPDQRWRRKVSIAATTAKPEAGGLP